jgi:alkylation response protein AidB-like acyl-CoA dehydrogenase
VLSACIAVEELGRVCYNTAYLLVVQWLPFGAILAGGTKEQRDRYLPGLASGELRGAFSTTESQSGSDVQGTRTKATPVQGGYRLDGRQDLVYQLVRRGFHPRCGKDRGRRR